ncbi:MAG: carbon monoxide dehydrogenase [Rhodospirillaceae bacterium]|nr:carbon monoxide dehydrogenase [Alphaproteobacteria bacterium]MBR73234.1 carbon monoxide dehydrogenase [Rhodospirillaceae bacterium]|tara:strand:- start:1784 stop:2563 length:780 start_codon:yes stop_codon:yes gene_type:complete
MYEFDYLKVSSINEAVSKFKELDDPRYLAGGHTLLPTMKQRLASPSHLVDISNIPDIIGISTNNNEVSIGSATTHHAVATSETINNLIPALAALANEIGDPQVRIRGTIGGSLANNDPAADYPAAALALKATIVTSEREISCDDFFVDLFETALNEGELITSVKFTVPQKASYVKFPNPASRYAIVGVMYAEFEEGARIAVTGAAPCVFRAHEMEEALKRGEELPEIIAEGLNSDIHAGAEYRAHLVKVMTKRAIENAK